MDDIEIEFGYFVLECRNVGAEKKAKKEIAARLQHSCIKLQPHISNVHIVSNMKGYVIVEAEASGENRHLFVEQLLGRTFTNNQSMGNPMRYAKRIVGEMTKEEVAKHLIPQSPTKGLNEGSLIEITKGVFMGEEARIITIDDEKRAVLVELFNADIPLRLKMKPNMIRRAN
jgi:transcription elongation factor Spt5